MKRLSALAFLVLFCSLAAADTIKQETIFGEIQINFFRPVAQSFTAVDPFLNSVSFYVDEFGSFSYPNVPITITLLNGDGLGGTAIATRLMQPPDFYFGWWSVNFDGTALTAGNSYTLRIESPNPYWGIAHGIDNPYAGGREYYDKGQCPTCTYNFDGRDPDLTFRINDPAANVPEPASVSLLASGAFALVMKKRRSRDRR